MGTPEKKRLHGRPRRRWHDNIKMDLQEVGRGAWTGLSWVRIGTRGGACKRGDEPSGSIKCVEFLDYLPTGYLITNDSAPWNK